MLYIICESVKNINYIQNYLALFHDMSVLVWAIAPFMIMVIFFVNLLD